MIDTTASHNWPKVSIFLLSEIGLSFPASLAVGLFIDASSYFYELIAWDSEWLANYADFVVQLKLKTNPLTIVCSLIL